MLRMISSPTLRSLTGDSTSREVSPSDGRFGTLVALSAVCACPSGAAQASDTAAAISRRRGKRVAFTVLSYLSFLKFGLSMSDTKQDQLTHFDATGQAHMVDVGAKAETHRIAVATGSI